jgi:excisionase family DNA binding protein
VKGAANFEQSTLTAVTEARAKVGQVTSGAVENVAERLNLHVKTVRRYIHDGRLKAKRIGKEYRVTHADLEEFAGAAPATEPPVARTRQVIASSIVDVDAISPEESHRVTTMVMAALNSRRGEPDHPRVDAIYYEERGRLRITITASPVLTSELLRLINALVEEQHEHL